MPIAETCDIQTYYDETGAGTPIILIHGGWSDVTEWASQKAALSEGHRLIRYDRRGCGRSEPKEVVQTPDLWVEDLRNLMDALNIHDAIVGGTSFGGMLTIEFMLSYPERVKAAVIVSATAGGYEGEAEYAVPFPDRLAALQDVRIPSLVVHGTDDDVFPVSDAEAIAGAIPNSKLAVLKGSHSVNVDSADQFNRTVLDWLGGLP